MAQVVRFHQIGEPEVLRVEQLDVPAPGGGEVQIAVIRDRLADGSLKPVIAKTFPLEQIVEAHRYLESNQQVGKVVVTVQQ
jgi:NADPH:quinone reductase-like Zn-dependent oxidoreductase